MPVVVFGPPTERAAQLRRHFVQDDRWRLDPTLASSVEALNDALLRDPAGSSRGLDRLLAAAAAAANDVAVLVDHRFCFTLPRWRRCGLQVDAALAWPPEATGDEVSVAFTSAAARSMADLPSATLPIDAFDAPLDLDALLDELVREGPGPAPAGDPEPLDAPDTTANAVVRFQVFWDDGHGFAESRSTSYLLRTSREPTTIRIGLPMTGWPRSLRIDVDDLPGTLHVDRLQLVVDGVVRWGDAGPEAVLRHADLSELGRHGGRSLVATGDDAHLVVSLPDEAVDGTTWELEVEIWAGPRPAAVPTEQVAERAATPSAPSDPTPTRPRRTAPIPMVSYGDDKVERHPLDWESWTSVGVSPSERPGWLEVTDWDPQLIAGPLEQPPSGGFELQIAVDGSGPAYAQVFFATADDPFRESSSLRIPLTADGRMHDYQVAIPAVLGGRARGRFAQLRLDPLDRPGQFRIGTVAMVGRVDVRSPEPRATTPDRTLDIRPKHARWVFVVSHSDYRLAMGGVERVMVAEERWLAERDISYVQVSPIHPSNRLERSGDLDLAVRVDGELVGTHPASAVADALDRLEGAGTARQATIAHHFLHWTLESLRAVVPNDDHPVILFAHDYFLTCSDFNLLYHGQVSCQGPPPASLACATCPTGAIRDDHLAAIDELLDLLHPIVHTPSHVAARLLLRAHPDLADMIHVSPIQEILDVGPKVPADLDRRLRVAHIGVPEPHKGWGTWRRLVDEWGLDDRYDLFHLGLGGHHSIDRYVAVDFRSAGPDAMLQALQDTGIDVALVWSNWPETFSLTAHEAVAAGCFVLASAESGNAAAVVAERGAGLVLDGDEELRRVLEAEGELRMAIEAAHLRRGELVDRSDYLEALASAAAR